jgi:hypothetical protein
MQSVQLRLLPAAAAAAAAAVAAAVGIFTSDGGLL